MAAYADLLLEVQALTVKLVKENDIGNRSIAYRPEPWVVKSLLASGHYRVVDCCEGDHTHGRLMIRCRPACERPGKNTPQPNQPIIKSRM